MYSPAPDYPAGIFSTWPRGRPLSDRDPWWREFTASRPTVAHRQLATERRDKLVSAAVDRMTKRPSPFNAEAPTRHKVRRALCLESWPWRDADGAAADIVERALTQLGAVRPTWAEGQPEWTQPGFDPILHTSCIRCGRKIPDERDGGNLGRAAVKFCSDICGQAEYAQRARRHGEQVTRAAHLARCAARKQRTLEVEIGCAGCGKPFRPGYAVLRRRFCSVACAVLHKRRRRPAQLFSCIVCAAQFRTRGGANKYCSPACSHVAQRLDVRGVEKQCPVCATIFRVATIQRQRCCSRRCAWMLRKRGEPAPAKPADDADDGQSEARRCA